MPTRTRTTHTSKTGPDAAGPRPRLGVAPGLLDRGTPLLMSEQVRVLCVGRDSVQSIWALWVLRQGHRQNSSRLRPMFTPVWTSSTPVFGQHLANMRRVEVT